MTVCVHALENVNQYGIYFTQVEGILLFRFMSCCEAKIRVFNSLFAGNLREVAFILCMMELGIL